MRIEKRYWQADTPRLRDINLMCFQGEQRPPDQTFRDMLMVSDVWTTRAEDNTIVGFAIVQPNPAPYLWSLAILPAYRREGFGGSVLDAVELYYAKTESEITLHVHSENVSAQRFYLARGYRVFGIEHEWYSDGLGIKMVKKLCS